MGKDSTSGVDGLVMPVADVLVLCASAACLLLGSYSVWNPALRTGSSHWIAAVALGSAAAVALSLLNRDRRLRAGTSASRMKIRVITAGWALTAFAVWLVFALRRFSMLNKEVLVLAELSIALLQALSAAGLWLHWLWSTHQRARS